VNPKNVWPVVTVALGGMTILGAMAIAGVNQQIIQMIAMAFIPTVLAALLVAPIAENRAATQAIQQQTNGNQAAQLALIAEQSRALAAAPPTTSPAAAPDVAGGGTVQP
jgi:hypothetical protein